MCGYFCHHQRDVSLFLFVSKLESEKVRDEERREREGKYKKSVVKIEFHLAFKNLESFSKNKVKFIVPNNCDLYLYLIQRMQHQSFTNYESRPDHSNTKRCRVNCNSEDESKASLIKKNNIETCLKNSIPIEALRLVVRSNYFKIHELGRLILFVSKAMTATLFKDDDKLWETLCRTHFGEEVIMLTKSIPNCNVRVFVQSRC